MTEHRRLQTTIVEAVLSETDDCILWPYGSDQHGYGRVRWDGKQQRTHRLVCRLVHGDPPPDRPLT